MRKRFLFALAMPFFALAGCQNNDNGLSLCSLAYFKTCCFSEAYEKENFVAAKSDSSWLGSCSDAEKKFLDCFNLVSFAEGDDLTCASNFDPIEDWSVWFCPFRETGASVSFILLPDFTSAFIRSVFPGIYSSGKDVFYTRPLSLSLEDGRLLYETAQRIL
jgi:hypothetical protein